MLKKLINKQTLPGIMNRMSLAGWKQLAKERPSWVQEDMEESILAICDSEVEGFIECGGSGPHRE